MLRISDVNKNLIGAITEYEDLCIESVLSTGDSTLSFYYHMNNIYAEDLQEEGYITTKNNEYVIKEINSNSSKLEVKASLNVEDLEGKTWEHFNTTNQNIEDCINLALAGTGWTIASCNITKRRTIKLTNCNSWQILREAKKTYRAEFKFNSINKKLYIYEKRGEDKGVYFIENLNLEALDIQSNTYDFYTRIIPKGKDDLGIESINNGKNYLENHQYSNKIKTLIWSDDRYTIVENLKEDAEYKLDELSKPYTAYEAMIKDLAKLNDKYKDILSFELGDTITLISKSKKVKEKQRIVKITEYPQNPLQNSCELANKTLTFEELQQDLIEVADTVDNITTDNGTIDGSSIDSIETSQIKDFNVSVAKITNLEAINATIDNLQANKADINSLNAVNAKIGSLEVTKANITDLQAANANISSLQASKADITDLEAAAAKIEVLEATTGKVQDLINGNLSSENIQASGITGDRLNMKTVFIDDANIVNVNASKMNTGELNTNKVKVKSEDGGIEIVGATQQFRDKNNKVRIQIGKDTKGDFNFILKGEDGTSTLIDHTGIKEKAIADNLIKENMINENAVGEKQIDYNSFATGFNKDSNTIQIKATKVKLDNQNQTLDVAFTNLKNQTDNTKTQTESNTTSINVQQGQINTAIANTKIIKNGKEVLLKDDYNTTIKTIDSIKNTISSHTTKIDANTGKITNVESKTNVLERDLQSMSSKITNVESNANNTKNTVTVIEQNLNSITQEVSSIKKSGITNLIPYSEFTAKSLIKTSWWIQGAGNWYDNPQVDILGFQNPTRNESMIYSKSIDISNMTEKVFSLYANLTTENTKAEILLIGSRNSNLNYDFVLSALWFDENSTNKGKYIENISIPDDINTIWVRVDNEGVKNDTASISNTLFVNTLNLTKGPLASTDKIINSADIAGLSIKNDEINLEVQKKVNETEIISKINQSAEKIKILAKFLELTGYATFNDLLREGATTINGSNITTGILRALQIKACHFSGKNMVYIEDDGILSCDGNTYLKNLFIPETHPGWRPGEIGKFSCAPSAFFDRDVHVANEIYTKGTGVVRRQHGVFIQVDALGVQQGGSGNNYLLVNCYKSNHVFGVDLWYSDAKLKENIIDLKNDINYFRNSSINKNKIGLELIKSINHFKFNYKNNDDTIHCGYIAQDLKKNNEQLVEAIKQNNEDILLQPKISTIVPNLSLAIQEQQKEIEFLRNKIKSLEELINKKL